MLSLVPLQPLDAGLVTSALPALLDALQPLPEAVPGIVTPPEPMSPTAPRVASIFFISFFMLPPYQ